MPAATRGDPPRVRWIGAKAALGLLLTVWGTFNIANGTPSVGTWWVVVLIVSVPMTLYQLGVLVYVGSKRARPRWSVRVLGLLACLVLGWKAAVWTEAWASAKSLEAFAARNAALLERLEKNRESLCAEMLAYLDEIAAGDDSVRRSGGNRFPVVDGLYHGERGYVITFRGGSIDIDGSTIVYDRSRGSWNIVHNDDARRREAIVDRAVRGLTQCNLR